MSLVSIERSPPPFFRQGPSAFTRLLFFSSLAVFLMAADTRLKLSDPLRAAVAVVLHPLERALLSPIQGIGMMSDIMGGIAQARTSVEKARADVAAQAARVLQVRQLEQENARLRELLELRVRLPNKPRSAEVLYVAPDPYTRKLIIDQGMTQGVERGAPVLDEFGLLGQVSRVYPLTAEVTLVTDRDAAVPVINIRTQQRSVAFGDASVGGMELKFNAANADLQVGDSLVTSGLDGVFPPGYPVATIGKIERRADSAFARILLTPASHADAARHVLILARTARDLPEHGEFTAPRDEKSLSGRRSGKAGSAAASAVPGKPTAPASSP
jgi:rod shape-determining protein MreC